MSNERVRSFEFFIPDEIQWENWRNHPICCFDLETTGADPEEADIVQICAMIFEKWEFVDEFTSLVCPRDEIPIDATKVHGISDTDVVDSPKFEEVAEDLVKFMYRADMLCGYNALNFDFPLLNNQIKKYTKKDLIVDLPVIDPLVWEREKRGKMSGNSLETAAKRYGVAEMHDIVHDGEGKFHDARSDVTVMKGVLKERAERLPYTVDQLIEEQMEYYEEQQNYLMKKYG